MALIKCKECGQEMSSTAGVCPHCGYKNDFHVCPDCGKEVSATDDFCPECGCPLHKKTAKASSVITENLDKITGVKSETYVTFKDLFKGTFKKHTSKELDDVFVCGSDKTTPDIKDIDPRNAGAWVYLKMFLFFLVAYIPMRIGYINFGNTNLLPGLIILGAFAMPVTVLIFFFEINVFRNIPFYKTMQYFIWGGALSLIFAILLFTLDLNYDISTYAGAITVGFIEEIPKAAIVALFIFKNKKNKFILNGLLVGAAVGAGFAAFETAGYIYRYGAAQGVASMLNTLVIRGFLAPGGHVAWAAIEGAALMLAKGFDTISRKHLNDKRFLLICLIPCILHGIWDMPFELPYYIKPAALTALAWIVIIYFINLGLKQVDEAKKLGISVYEEEPQKQ